MHRLPTGFANLRNISLTNLTFYRLKVPNKFAFDTTAEIYWNRSDQNQQLETKKFLKKIKSIVT